MDIKLSKKTNRMWCGAMLAHLGLLCFVVVWQGGLSPHPHFSAWIMACLWAIPLLLPLAGMWQKKPYTHAWANFVLMLYFLHGFTILYIDASERYLAAIEILLTSSAFIANIVFSRFRGRELGLKLTRLSEVEKQESSQFSTHK